MTRTHHDTTAPGHDAAPDTGTAAGAAAALASTTEVRARAGMLLDRARGGGSAWFVVDDGALSSAAAVVADVTRTRYPDLTIPYHSRWRHFEAAGVDRTAALDDRLVEAGADTAATARAQIDLAVVSVLLDAGAGPDWRFCEASERSSRGGRRIARSEGLAVASWHAFTAGLFSSDPTRPLRVDSAALRGLDADRLAAAFQVGPSNPLVGLDGRLALLHRLSEALAGRPDVFGPDGRPGGLFDTLTAGGGPVAAHTILATLLGTLSSIWPSGNVIDDGAGGRAAVGDCWRHVAARGPGLTDGWMPFHKLSQWLTYSLLEPLEWAGVTVTGLDALTGLPEYRNGGLLLDTGVLRLRDPALAARRWDVADEAIVEWRALTVALLDELAPRVRDRLHVEADAMPLACVLEGGTWAAGRELAGRWRGGLPPLTIASDGTVF